MRSGGVSQDDLDIPLQDLYVPYVDNELEYVARTAPFFGKGVHVLVSTLAEFRATRKEHANWVHDFVTAFTARLPAVVQASEYMEAYLHASHFPYIDSNHHVQGCMPLRLYKDTESQRRGFVPLERYVKEVLSDCASTRAYDESWIAYAFSALLMKRLDTDQRRPLIRRGLNHALRHNTEKEYEERFGEHIMPSMLYDERQAHRHISEICAAIRRFGWPTYFHTQTCNQREFPGLADTYKTIADTQHDVRHFEAYIVRRWHRSAHLFAQWILHGTDKPLGNVRHLWYRHEFQTDIGNLPHLHMLIWTDEDMAAADESTYFRDASVALERTSADITHAFDYVVDPIRRQELRDTANLIHTTAVPPSAFFQPAYVVSTTPDLSTTILPTYLYKQTYPTTFNSCL